MQLEIDDEIYQHLLKNAQGFDETPEIVLRRLLLGDDAKTIHTRKGGRTMVQTDTPGFVQRILNERLGGGFSTIGRYRFLFQSDNRIVYFQNFRDEGNYDNWWYRIVPKAFIELEKSTKPAAIYLTNPTSSVYYELPFDEFKEKTASIKTDRGIEVNINHTTNIWTSLDWDIREYKKVLE